MMTQSASARSVLPKKKGSHEFRLFLSSMFALAVGRTGYQLAGAWVLVAAGHGSSAVAVFFMIVSLTELISSPLAGWISDCGDRRLLCILADGMRSALMMAMALAITNFDVRATIWLSAIVFASCDRITLTASQAMIPTVDTSFHPAKTNSLVFFVMQAGSLGAASLTGLLLHMSSTAMTFLALSSAFALSAFFMERVRRKHLPLKDRPEILEFLPVAKANFIFLCAFYALLYSGGILVSVMGAGFVLEELGGNALDFGWMESAWSAGSILGALLLIPLANPVPLTYLPIITLALSAVCFAVLSLVNLTQAFLMFAALGGLYNMGRVALEIMTQSLVSSAFLGRAKGLLHSFAVFGGLILFGIIALMPNAMAPSSVFLGFAFVLVFGAIALHFLPRAAS